MKKLLLILLASLGVNAQTLLQENFDALGSPIALPTGWEMSNLSSPIGTATWFRGNTASFSSYNGPADGYIAVNFQSGSGTSTLNNWLLSPPVTVQNGDEVSFYTRVPAGSTWPDRLQLRQSVLGASSTAPTGLTGLGSYTTLCLSVNPSLTTTGYPDVWTKYTYVVTGLTGSVSCRYALRYTVSNGGPNGANSNYVGVDAFQVKRPVNDDLSLNSVTVPPITTPGSLSFTGTVQNQGSNTVTAYQVTWSANGGATNTYTVSGVNIAPSGTHDFTHDIPLTTVIGQSYALTFTVTTVNGVADGNTADNSLLKNTQVASGSTAFKPLIEKFTSSTCAPCASYNGATFNPFYNATYASDTYNYVAYQMNWPGNGDPYYTAAEGGVRRAFYGVNAITSLWVDGSEYGTENNQATLTAHINSEGSKPGYFQLDSTQEISFGTVNVNYNITPYLSGDYVMHAALIEKLTTGNVSTNGETSFKHVMMKMVPDASGTPITFTAGTPVSGQISADIENTFIEEMTDLEVIVFIQNPTTREIMGSLKATDLLAVNKNTINKTKIYPNPAQNVIKLSNIDLADIVITDVTGKTVVSMKNVTDSSDINVSELVSGIYFVSVKNEKFNETVKFVKK